MAVWRHFDIPEVGYAHLLSATINQLNQQYPNLLWRVDHGLQVMFSDYSGQHKQATHEAHSFLVVAWDDLSEWLSKRERFRSRWLPDQRRISFKQLREPVRRRAYPHFLELAGQLRANQITIMVDRRVGTFISGGPLALAAELDDCFLQNATSSSIEKIYRLAMFVAMIQAGLRSEQQRSLWISDHDETLDTHEKRERFARLASYLTFGLTGWRNPAEQRFATTESAGLPRWVEDVAAIPDIAAGACVGLSNQLPTFVGHPIWKIPLRYSNNLDWRCKVFGDWLSAPSGILRHILLRLEPDRNGEIRASVQQFVRRPDAVKYKP